MLVIVYRYWQGSTTVADSRVSRSHCKESLRPSFRSFRPFKQISVGKRPTTFTKYSDFVFENRSAIVGPYPILFSVFSAFLGWPPTFSLLQQNKNAKNELCLISGVCATAARKLPHVALRWVTATKFNRMAGCFVGSSDEDAPCRNTFQPGFHPVFSGTRRFWIQSGPNHHAIHLLTSAL